MLDACRFQAGVEIVIRPRHFRRPSRDLIVPCLFHLLAQRHDLIVPWPKCHMLCVRQTDEEVYAEGVRILSALPMACVLAISAWAQTPGSQPPQTVKFYNTYTPRFEDFPLSEHWSQSPTPLKLVTRSERMFRTQFANAAKEPPNFAGHYRIAYWGCGSNCSAAALVDLRTGEVFPPPLSNSNGTGWERWIMCTASFDGANDEFHLDSRLMIVRCGMNYSERLQKNIPDTYYFLWERNGFQQLLHISGKAPGS
jgi:hypothetical protein